MKNKELMEELQLIKKRVLSKDVDEESGVRNIHYIYTYKLNNLQPPKKVLFSFALFGRKENDGLLRQTGGEKLGSGCIFVPEGAHEKIEDFFKFWGVEYRKIRVKVLDTPKQ